jgi:hypothetical protein
MTDVVPTKAVHLDPFWIHLISWDVFGWIWMHWALQVLNRSFDMNIAQG